MGIEALEVLRVGSGTTLSDPTGVDDDVIIARRHTDDHISGAPRRSSGRRAAGAQENCVFGRGWNSPSTNTSTFSS